MPYISTEEVREKRQRLKAALPQFKFSIRKQDHMKISVTILSGPIEMTKNPIKRVHKVVIFIKYPKKNRLF